jgi:HD-GYP domain-containing protein (c-di-GMP phosphodiesterase class II)
MDNINTAEEGVRFYPVNMKPEQQADEDQRVFIPIEWLQPGTPVESDIYSGTTRLLAAGSVITAGILIALKSRNINQVEVRRSSELAKAPALPPELELGSQWYPHLHKDANAIYREHGIATAVDPDLLEEGTLLVEELFNSYRQHGTLETGRAMPLVKELVRQYSDNQDKPVKLLDLDRYDRYTYRHSINVALLYITIAIDWCILREHLEELVLAAMLHDAGKARIDSAVLNKRGPLTDAEWEQVCHHPEWGMEMVGAQLDNEPCRSIILGHHERLDGSGYPGKQLGFGIDQYARLAAVCDIYDALTTTRSYKGKLDFSRAIDILVHGAGTLLDPALVHQFIRCTGRFPIGTFVRLNTGDVGVVKHINTDALWRPVVALVMDSTGAFLRPGGDVDLRLLEKFFITGIISNTDEPE